MQEVAAVDQEQEIAWTRVEIWGDLLLASVSIRTNDADGTGGKSFAYGWCNQYRADEHMTGLSRARLAAIEIIQLIPRSHVVSVYINGVQTNV